MSAISAISESMKLNLKSVIGLKIEIELGYGTSEIGVISDAECRQYAYTINGNIVESIQYVVKLEAERFYDVSKFTCNIID